MLNIINLINNTGIFWCVLAVSVYIIRYLADYARLRLYIKSLHVHHFTYSIIAVIVALIYYQHMIIPQVMLGVAVSLMLSELKDIILNQWTP